MLLSLSLPFSSFVFPFHLLCFLLSWEVGSRAEETHGDTRTSSIKPLGRKEICEESSKEREREVFCWLSAEMRWGCHTFSLSLACSLCHAHTQAPSEEVSPGENLERPHPT